MADITATTGSLRIKQPFNMAQGTRPAVPTCVLTLAEDGSVPSLDSVEWDVLVESSGDAAVRATGRLAVPSMSVHPIARAVRWSNDVRPSLPTGACPTISFTVTLSSSNQVLTKEIGILGLRFL